MVYISADGTIGEKGRNNNSRNPIRFVSDKFFRLKPHWKAASLVCVAIIFRSRLNPNPLADGKVPAADLKPEQHWDRILKDDTFVRAMSGHLDGATSSRRDQAKAKREYLERAKEMKITLDWVDFGGLDGHVAEKGDWNDIKYFQGTRCSTARSAITAYFCGAQVAGNQDAALEKDAKLPYSGVKSFSDFTSCRHKQGESKGDHRRSVYRIGISTEASLSGYSHAFSIIAQPDGSFFWLQSFISHYSLPKWMSKMDEDGTPHADLTLDGLQTKLKQVDRLMKISGWSSQANTDYLELFGVDKEQEAMDRHKPPVRLTWEPSHRLKAFYWDEACEYPTPYQQPDAQQEQASTTTKTFADECAFTALQGMMEELGGASLSGSGDQGLNLW